MSNTIESLTAQGWWSVNGSTEPSWDENALGEAILDINRPVTIVEKDGRYAASDGGVKILGGDRPDSSALPIAGYVPACRLESLGDPSFCDDHGIRYAYIAGAMANGIGSADIVEDMSRAGLLAFFGAAGLSPERIESEIDRIQKNLGDAPYGFNLIHNPNEPDQEAAVVDLYLRRSVNLVSASAYLDLTLPVVRYRVHGIHRDENGEAVTPNRIVAKVSRVEVATKFMSPPPERFLKELVVSGDITAEQADMASGIPMAQDLTAEADSGGHTDNRPAIALIPTLLALRDQMQEKFGYRQSLRIGAAGGISTPASAAAAFAMGASYILTGSVNQACVESGSSDIVREMLAEARQADVIMAPAADMFEMGVKVQVLKRGTMFAMRGAKLYELYRNCDSIEAIPTAEKASLEKSLFRSPLETIWEQTREFFQQRDPSQIERAESEPKHKMALVFRWYLGQSSRWANSGEPSRQVDYQVWCGPSMGAFNEWVKGTFLEETENRRVVTVALNILYGAAMLNRINSLKIQGVRLAPKLLHVPPLELEALQQRLNS